MNHDDVTFLQLGQFHVMGKEVSLEKETGLLLGSDSILAHLKTKRSGNVIGDFFMAFLRLTRSTIEGR